MTRGIHWYYDSLTPGLRLFPFVVDRKLQETFDDLAKDVEDYAQENAPWDDQSGDAREGLTAVADGSLFHHAITLFHTVDYGIWLEIRWNGRYAIIQPTIEHFGPIVMGQLDM